MLRYGLVTASVRWQIITLTGCVSVFVGGAGEVSVATRAACGAVAGAVGSELVVAAGAGSDDSAGATAAEACASGAAALVAVSGAVVVTTGTDADESPDGVVLPSAKAADEKTPSSESASAATAAVTDMVTDFFEFLTGIPLCTTRVLSGTVYGYCV